MGKIKVLMLGNHSSVKGGITSVIEQLRGYDWNECEVEMKLIISWTHLSPRLRALVMAALIYAIALVIL